jgi:hypothetical protein
MTDETAIGGDNVRFQPTAWTVVREAPEGSRDALDRLIAVYWKPVYFFIRRRGQDVESAKDLTQAFFGSLLEREFKTEYARKRWQRECHLIPVPISNQDPEGRSLFMLATTQMKESAQAFAAIEMLVPILQRKMREATSRCGE